jgi:hypothetical protein
MYQKLIHMPLLSPVAWNLVVLSKIFKLFALQVLNCWFLVFILAIHNYLIIMQNCKAPVNKFIPDFSYVLEFLWQLRRCPRFLMITLVTASVFPVFVWGPPGLLATSSCYWVGWGLRSLNAAFPWWSCLSYFALNPRQSRHSLAFFYYSIRL